MKTIQVTSTVAKQLRWVTARNQFSDEQRAIVNGPRWANYIRMIHYIERKKGAWVAVNRECAPLLRSVNKGTKGQPLARGDRQARRVAYTLAASTFFEIGTAKGPHGEELYIRSIKTEE